MGKKFLRLNEQMSESLNVWETMVVYGIHVFFLFVPVIGLRYFFSFLVIKEGWKPLAEPSTCSLMQKLPHASDQLYHLPRVAVAWLGRKENTGTTRIGSGSLRPSFLCDPQARTRWFLLQFLRSFLLRKLIWHNKALGSRIV